MHRISSSIRATCLTQGPCGVLHLQLASRARNINECYACAAGRVDLDFDPATACVACGEGKFRPATGSAFPPYSAGSNPTPADTMLQAPGTFCYDCPFGSEQLTSERTQLEDCTSCPAGKSDRDTDTTTACETCAHGYYARPPPDRVTEGGGRFGPLGEGCLRCPGSIELPQYSTVDKAICVDTCPIGQYGLRLDMSLEQLLLLDPLWTPAALDDGDESSSGSASWSNWEDNNDSDSDSDSASGSGSWRRMEESELETLFSCVMCLGGALCLSLPLHSFALSPQWLAICLD